MLDNFFWTGIFLGLPAVLLVAAPVRIIIKYTRHQQNGRHWHNPMGTVVLAAIAVALLVRFANEKFFLVMALLCWVYLVAWVLRQALGLPPTARHPATPEAQDPIALNFFGVDRGFQSFGIYLHGVRVGNDPINNDTR